MSEPVPPQGYAPPPPAQPVQPAAPAAGYPYPLPAPQPGYAPQPTHPSAVHPIAPFNATNPMQAPGQLGYPIAPAPMQTAGYPAPTYAPVVQPGYSGFPQPGASAATAMHHGQPYGMHPGPAMSANRPTVWPVVVLTILFGVFGLIPAFLRASEARRMGLPERPYWQAWAITFACWLALVIVL